MFRQSEFNTWISINVLNLRINTQATHTQYQMCLQVIHNDKSEFKYDKWVVLHIDKNIQFSLRLSIRYSCETIVITDRTGRHRGVVNGSFYLKATSPEASGVGNEGWQLWHGVVFHTCFTLGTLAGVLSKEAYYSHVK